MARRKIEVHVGDVIRATYYKFTGEVDEDGLFLVCSLDNYWVKDFSGFSAIKLCTKPEIYQVELTKDKFPFLDHTSYVNCNCMQRLSLDQVNEILGVVDSTALYCVMRQLNNFNNDIGKQLKRGMKRYDMFAQLTQNNVDKSNSNEEE